MVWLSVFSWLYVCVCVTAAGCVWVRVNPQRHKAPMPLCSCQQPPSPRLWLGRSWGLTFHFSDPLFHRANSYAGLEMCYVAGWDKNQGQFQNNLWPPSQGYFCSLPLLPVRFDDLISITNLAVNKDIIYIQRTFIIVQKTCLRLTNTVVYFSLLLALKFISYLLHKLVLHISIRFLYSRSIPNHSNCFLLLPLWVWRDYALQLQMIVLQLDGESKIRMCEYIVTKLKFHTIISPPAATTALNALRFISAVYLWFQGAL